MENQPPEKTAYQWNPQELLERYKIRLKTIWTSPNPFYTNKLYEISEVNVLIKKLEKITNEQNKQMA